jgi:hypothetical protein
MPPSPPYRIYIDESGDHTYKRVRDLSRRYLGLTGVVIRKSRYDPAIPAELEQIKRGFFAYDADMPPILTRKDIIKRRGLFRVLLDPAENRRWENTLLDFFRDTLRAQIFTVVIDKEEHQRRYPVDTWNPYAYSLAVLLRRIRGWLRLAGATADIMPEARGDKEDNQLLAAYVDLRTNGSSWGSGDEYREVFPEGRLLFRRKDQNVAGLQIADLVVAEQKALTIQESGRLLHRAIGPFGRRLNDALATKVNQYGRYFLK